MKSLLTLDQTLDKVSTSARKLDMVARPQDLSVEVVDGKVSLAVKGGDNTLPINPYAQRQLASYTGIGTRYAEKMYEAEKFDLLADNFNSWLQDETSNNRRMIRTIDNNVRAFLSDKYMVVDNDLVAKSALTALADTGIELDSFKSLYADDDSMFLKVAFPKTETEIKLNDPVQIGIALKNNEVGNGSLSIELLVYRLVCTNGMISAQADGSYRRRHAGARIQGDRIVYSQHTIQAQGATIAMEVGDAVRTWTQPDNIARLLKPLRDATQTTQATNPEKTVEVLAKHVGLTDAERSSVLETFIRDQDYSKYGAVQAITEQANTHDDYFRATELEKLGGQVLTLTDQRWERFATAA